MIGNEFEFTSKNQQKMNLIFVFRNFYTKI